MALWERQETIVLWIVVALLFVGTVMLGFFWLFHRYKRRQFEERLNAQAMEYHFKDSLRLSALDVQEKERARLANDLHDALIGHLATLLWSMELNTPREMLREKVTFCIDEARRIAHDLYPPMLKEKTVEQVLSDLFGQWADRFEIDFTRDIRVPDAGTPQVKLHVLRIVQELLVNSLKHGRASAVRVQLRTSGRCLLFRYADNGQGMQPDRPYGLGMKSIQNRILMLNGKYKVRANPGFQLLLMIPEWKEK